MSSWAMGIIRVLVVAILFSSNAGRAVTVDSVEPGIGTEVATTRHTILLGGRSLSYTARAGYVRILDEATGQVRAKMYFASFTVDPQHGEPTRPLTFFTNGGPGGAATLSIEGPRVVKDEGPAGELPPPPYELVDNQQTWLSVTDLVLIDPVGTGYSRAVKPEYAAEFYNPGGDAKSVAQLVQNYLKDNDPTFRHPIFLAGHSYGSVRSALVSEVLAQRGIPLRGLFLASSALEQQPARSDQAYIGLLPTFTATAFVHKKLAPDLQRNFRQTRALAESWSAANYSTLLSQGDQLSGEHLKMAAIQMARLTGLSPTVVADNRLRFLPDAFLRELLGEEWTPLGLTDSRHLKPDELQLRYDPKWDTVLSGLYLGDELPCAKLECL